MDDNSRPDDSKGATKETFLSRLGPGLITGASDDDPSGIGTYSQAGAQLGFGIGWTMLITYPLMVAIQEISGRIGRTTGHGIAGNVCRNYPAPVIWSLVALLFVANTINIAADLGAMGDALKLFVGGPAPLYVLVFGTISVLALSVAIGIALNFVPIDPIQALYWSAVINGILAAPVMVIMMLLVRKQSVMGDLIVKGPVYWLGWLATLAMALCVVGMGFSFFS